MKRVTRKFFAAVLAFTMLFSTTAALAETAEDSNGVLTVSTEDARFVLRDNIIYQEAGYNNQENDFVDYWSNRIDNNCLSYSNYEVNTETVDSSNINDISWKEDKPSEELFPVVRENAYDVLSGVYAGILSGSYADVLSGSYVDVLSGSYVDVLSGSYVDVLSGSYVDVLSGSYVDVLSGSYVNIPTGYPTGVMSGSYVVIPRRPYIPPQKPTEVVAVPVVNDPTTVTYNVDVEVGRRVHIAPQQLTHTTLSSSDESILSAPYRREAGDYPSFAYKPGIATLSFYSEKQQFTENWNVRVYTRALDFEQKEYVAERTGEKDYEYVYLRLKNFEHTFEPAYYFEWSSSDSSVAEIYGGDPFSTFVRLRLKKQGATIVTVKDMFGNESSCVLIVKNTLKYMLENTKITFAAKNYKQRTAILSWNVNTELDLDGYQICASTNRGKSYKAIKNVKKASTLKYYYKKLKAGKTYYFKMRGYKLVDGKRQYTPWSKVKSFVVKANKSKK